MTPHTWTFFSRSSRDSLLGSHPAQLPRIQEEAVEDDRSGPGLRSGGLAGPVQRGLRDGPEGDPLRSSSLSVPVASGSRMSNFNCWESN